MYWPFKINNVSHAFDLGVWQKTIFRQYYINFVYSDLRTYYRSAKCAIGIVSVSASGLVTIEREYKVLWCDLSNGDLEEEEEEDIYLTQINNNHGNSTQY